MGRGREQEYFASGVGESEGRGSFSLLEADRKVPRSLRGDLQRKIQDFGLSYEWLGKQPPELPDDHGTLYRYQYATIYLYPVGFDPDTGSPEQGRIEIKTEIYTVGTPPDLLKTRIRQDNDRVTTLFNTGPYDGYLSGFNILERNTLTEGPEPVAREEANNLGIPQFKVEIYDEQTRLSGVSSGFFDPFDVRFISRTVGEEPPENEVWNIRFQPERGTYEFTTTADARERARNVAETSEKDIYINGIPTGKTLRPARGTFEIKKKYQRQPEGVADREDILQESGANPQAFADNGNAYKVEETADAIFFVLTRPEDFDPKQPTAVDPTAIGEREIIRVRVRFADSTEFDVRRDERLIRHLGLYSPPVEREIQKGTTL